MDRAGWQRLERSTGRIELGVRVHRGTTRVAHLLEQGCGRVRFPRAPDGLEVLLLNNAGGLADGDTLEQTMTVGAGARLTAATASAEKVYRARTLEPARVTTRLEVDAGGTLVWLPQATILFDSARLRRRLDIDLAAGATLLMAELLVFGRTARGEVVRSGFLHDARALRLDGRLVRLDALRLEGDMAEALDRAAVADGARALGTLLAVADGLEPQLDTIRGWLDALPGRAGASYRAPVLTVRFLAPDGLALQRAVAEVVQRLLSPRGRPAALPRVRGC